MPPTKPDDDQATTTTAAEAVAAAASPEPPSIDLALHALVASVNEGKVAEDELDKRRVKRVLAGPSVFGIPAGQEGWAPADSETAAAIEAGMLTEV